VEAAWNQVTSIAASTDITVDETRTNASLTRFQSQPLDGYDLLITLLPRASFILSINFEEK
jgi:hypothetical protein